MSTPLIDLTVALAEALECIDQDEIDMGALADRISEAQHAFQSVREAMVAPACRQAFRAVIFSPSRAES